MKVSKSKTVTVELTREDVIEAIRLFAVKSHPSLKSAGYTVDLSTEVDDATVTFTVEAKEPVKT